ncbi:unnamed protein product, partial [Owenia fusiformis]
MASSSLDFLRPSKERKPEKGKKSTRRKHIDETRHGVNVKQMPDNKCGANSKELISGIGIQRATGIAIKPVINNNVSKNECANKELNHVRNIYQPQRTPSFLRTQSFEHTHKASIIPKASHHRKSQSLNLQVVKAQQRRSRDPNDPWFTHDELIAQSLLSYKQTIDQLHDKMTKRKSDDVSIHYKIAVNDSNNPSNSKEQTQSSSTSSPLVPFKLKQDTGEKETPMHRLNGHIPGEQISSKDEIEAISPVEDTSTIDDDNNTLIDTIAQSSVYTQTVSNRDIQSISDNIISPPVSPKYRSTPNHSKLRSLDKTKLQDLSNSFSIPPNMQDLDLDSTLDFRYPNRYDVEEQFNDDHPSYARNDEMAAVYDTGVKECELSTFERGLVSTSRATLTYQSDL